MHITRLTVVLLLILGIILMTSPLMRGEVSQAWAHARPGVLQFMDGVYASIRDFIAGTGTGDGIDDNAPDEEFEIILTKEGGVLF